MACFAAPSACVNGKSARSARARSAHTRGCERGRRSEASHADERSEVGEKKEKEKEKEKEMERKKTKSEIIKDPRIQESRIQEFKMLFGLRQLSFRCLHKLNHYFSHKAI